MTSRSSGDVDSAGGRLGGARADFVASLGRKVYDARELLAALEDDPSSKQARDELRRRLHALGAGARLLRFEAMFRSLQEALGVLDRGAQLGALREQEVAFVAQVVDDLPALAWGEAPPSQAPPSRPPQSHAPQSHAPQSHTPQSHTPQSVPPPSHAPPSHAPPHGTVTAAAEEEGGAGVAPVGAMPIAVLVVGDEALADALGDDGALRPRAFESERTGDAQTALQLARAYAPDLMLVDLDRPHAVELVDALLADPLTEPVPIVVVGTFQTAEQAARVLALGVARVLSKPVAPDALAEAFDEILDAAREGRAVRVTLGEPTLERLVDRLSEELKRGLLDTVEAGERSVRVPLGEGTEVLGALWAAIARVQDIVSQKTGGEVRFAGSAAEGTVIALAPWLHGDVPGSERLGTRGRGAAAEVRLQGRRVVVADDDPGVTWFMADLLRTAGCEVHEALDGSTALDLAYRIQPDLVVSDILMPRMDGFALSRALKRDVALRDVPVILLSWKEDLLQRVRELGASAAAYMRKETDSQSILARVREVLRPRARIETRLRGDGEVRGRLDGLTPRLLLELVGAARRDARVAVRDASYLYEIEIRGGSPRKATRTASDGGYARGARVLASLLGVGAGRFVVSPGTGPIRGELTGTLFDQLAQPIAAARGAVAASTGARTMHVERIALDDASLEDYLRATPDPARAMIQRLIEGASPRQMLLAGGVAPALLEDVLVDLASRGAILAVEGLDGVDLLTPAVEAALAVLQGESTPLGPGSYESISPSVRPPPGRAAGPSSEDPPSSLEDAVMREISDRSPNPGSARVPPSDPPPIVEPSALRKRSSNPPADDEGTLDAVEEWVPLGSLPPDAMVPDAAMGDEPFPVSPSAPSAAMTARETAQDGDPEGQGDSDPPFHPEPEAEYDTEVEAMYSSPFALTEQRPPPPVWGAPPPTPVEPTVPLSLPAPSPAEVRTRETPSILPRRSPWTFVAVLALLGLAVGALVYAGNDRTQATPAPARAPSATPPAVPASTTAPPAAAGSAPATTDPGDELPPGAEVPPGFGLIEVTAPTGAQVRVDGAIAGTGPAASLVAAPGYHEVRVELDGQDSKDVIEVRSGKTVRVRSSSGP
jgi:CheY-like chemotaxis protein